MRDCYSDRGLIEVLIVPQKEAEVAVKKTLFELFLKCNGLSSSRKCSAFVMRKWFLFMCSCADLELSTVKIIG
ncbi:hypothetical protein CGG88_21505 [Vibrio parahaemolyticus]|nr:hypothetical protein CGG88_21505 [Vibrio parahaemolyticus]